MDINLKLTRTRLMASAATSLALIFVAGQGAVAQEADESDAPVSTTTAEAAAEDAAVDTVVVTGSSYRESLENSVAAKRESSSIVEVVSAEDIGKLPDASIAESLARLPGLASQRVRGRSTVITVRGAGPDFVGTVLNGREQVSSGDNRGVEFDQFPSEFISQAVVYKTPDAQLIGQGWGGTVDLRTVRPLDKDERTIALGARYELADIGALNSGSEDTGYRVTGTYIDQFANDTVGVALAVATQNSPTQAERFESWGYPQTGTPPAYVLGGIKPYVESRELKRDAVAGVFEFEPSDAFHTTVDVFYSKFEDEGVLRGIEFPLFWSGATLQPGFTRTRDLVSGGQFNGVRGVQRNDARGRDAELLSAGWNIEGALGDKWSYEADLSYSKAERSDVDLELYSGAAPGVTDNLAFALNGDGYFVFDGNLNYADPTAFALTDPNGWGQVGFIKRPATEDEIQAIRFSLARELDSPALSEIEFGANYTTREKSKTSLEDFIDFRTPGTTRVPVPSQYLLAPTSLGFLGVGNTLSFDPLALFYGTNIYALRPNRNNDVLTKAWTAEENVLTLYTMAKIDTLMGEVPLTGNVGLQFVSTEQTSSGVAPIGGGNIAAVTDGDDYWKLLPSMNLRWAPEGDWAIRVGVARTLSRPRMDQLSISGSPGVNITSLNTLRTTGVAPFNPPVITSSSGNPLLQPYVANNFDVSVEKYLPEGGYVQAALFRKNIVDWVDDSSAQIYTFSPSVLNALVASGSLLASDLALPGIALGGVLAPTNFSGGSVEGFEVATYLPFAMWFDGPLDGFGAQASYTYTTSDIQQPDRDKPDQIPGLSKDIINLTLFYEKAGFDARISSRYRSDFKGEIPGFGANLEQRSISEETVVDAQVGYRFLGGPLENLGVTLQAYNLTDEDYFTYENNDPLYVKNWERYGTTYMLGVSYKF